MKAPLLLTIPAALLWAASAGAAPDLNPASTPDGWDTDETTAVPSPAEAPLEVPDGTEGNAQEPPKPLSVEVTVNPAAMLQGMYGAEASLGLSHVLAVAVQGQSISIKDVRGFGVGVGMQIFPGKELFRGWFVYPQLAYIDVLSTTTDRTAKGLGFGGIGGYQWMWSFFAMRLGGGFVYYTGKGADSGSGESAQFSGASPVVDLSFGAAF